MKKVEKNKKHDAFAEMFIEELQVLRSQPNHKKKETDEDPLVLFAYWILLPLFFASITVLAIVIFNTLFGL